MAESSLQNFDITGTPFEREVRRLVIPFGEDIELRLKISGPMEPHAWVDIYCNYDTIVARIMDGWLAGLHSVERICFDSNKVLFISKV